MMIKRSIAFLLFAFLGSVIFAQSLVSFHTNRSDECVPSTVNIVNTSDVINITGTAVYRWYLNGVLFSTVQHPDPLLIENPGHYYIELYIYDSHDMSLVGTSPWHEFHLGQRFNDYRISTLEACPEETVIFEAPPGAASIEWIFDSNILTGNLNLYQQRISYIFKKPGQYKVALVVFGQCGIDTIRKVISIKEDAIPTITPLLSETSVCPNQEIQFNVLGRFQSYQWDFGDGGTSDLKAPVHTYPDQEDATYHAKITVANSCGGFATDSVEVKISTDLDFPLDFSFYPINGYGNMCPFVEIQFESFAQGNHFWDFGDGETSNENKPVHRYSASGTYTATLSLMNGCGLKTSISRDITVEKFEEESLFPYFEVIGYYDEIIYICPGENLKFRNYTQQDKELLFEWNMGDGTIKRELNATHIFSTPGEYNVSLTARSFCGTEDTYTKTIIVSVDIEPQDVRIGIAPTSICPGENVYFFDEVFDPSKNYSYDFIFGDGNELTGITNFTDSNLHTLANHVYETEGTYNYTVRVTNNCGKSNEFPGVVNVGNMTDIKSFYYISNSTAHGDRLPPGNFGQRSSLTDHEFSVSVNWPAWQPEYGNVFYLLVYYGEFDDRHHGDGDLDGASRFPNGYVRFISDNIIEGENVTFYVPMNPVEPPIISLAAAFYCNGEMDMEDMPDANGYLYDNEGNRLTVPLEPSGNSDINSIFEINGITIDPDFYGICRKETPNGKWYRQTADGYYAVLEINVDFISIEAEHYYSLYLTDRLDHSGSRSYISSGNIIPQGTAPSRFDTVYFEDFLYCMSGAQYSFFSLVGNQIEFNPESADECSDRRELLSGVFARLSYDLMNDLSVCPGDPVRFNVAGGKTYVWNFGDGNTSTEQHPLHAYSDTGTYKVTLVATDGCNRVDTLHTLARVNNQKQPVAQIYYSPHNPRSNDTVYFNGSEHAGEHQEQYFTDTYLWNFGDGTTSDKPMPKHVYTQAGEYTVTLTTSNGCGSNSNTIPVKVGSSRFECIARFNFDIEENTAYFNDLSAGEITSWQWDFGDGQSSSEKNPVHTYEKEGTYYVTLTIFSETTNCIASQKRKLTIGEPACQAGFTFFVNNNTGLASFSADVSNADQFYWDFGDGNFSTELNPRHTFPRPGIYKVCLIVWNDQTSCMAKHCHEVSYGDISMAGIKPDFSYIVDHDKLKVRFTELSTETNLRWYWTFGDGSISKEKYPSHTYKKAGRYQVCLNLMHPVSGRAYKICKEIIVGEDACNINLAFSHFTDPVNRTIIFRNESTGKITDWFWDFGDGSSSIRKHPKKVYEKPGYYPVSLSARNSENGCTDQHTLYIQAGPVSCKAKFSYDFNPETNTVKFRNESHGNTLHYFWDFGDGNHSNDINPVHTYASAGLYYPSLTVSYMNNLCMDREVQVIQAGEIDCGARFEVFIDSSANTAYFTNRAFGESTNLLWIFGDGTYSTDHNPVHTFSVPGYYSVTLNTYNSNTGCMDQFTSRVVISKIAYDAKADFSFRPEPMTGKVEFQENSLGDIREYHWDFGDGETSDEQNPVHIFTKPGYKYVCLNVINAMDIPDMICKWVPVDIPPGKDCNADFYFNVDPATRKVVFADRSAGKPNKWNWDFGDGNTSTDKTPGHIYAESGYYGVKLTVTNTLTGCKSSTYKLINVAETGTLKAGFAHEAFGEDKKVSGYPVDFVGASSGDGTKYEWDFGDKKHENKKSDFIVQFIGSNIVRYIYPEPGIYTACLRVTNPKLGLSDIYCQTVETLYGISVEQFPADHFQLDVHPNPFNERTKIDLSLAEPTFVELTVFDQLGRAIDTLVRNEKDSGEYTIYWNAQSFSPGMYYLKLTTPHGTAVKQLVLTR